MTSCDLRKVLEFLHDASVILKQAERDLAEREYGVCKAEALRDCLALGDYLGDRDRAPGTCDSLTAEVCRRKKGTGRASGS